MDGSVPRGARIGPNAILQLVPVLDRLEGRGLRDEVLALAGATVPPPDAGMWPEAACRAVHLAVYLLCGDRAERIMDEAGKGTADYILAHRIPVAAQRTIRAVPPWIGARLLTSAVARHAWTFAGSGSFGVDSHAPLTLKITSNPLAPGGPSHWHAAVFTRLYQALVWPQAFVETREDPGSSRFIVHARPPTDLGC
jgi:divinyl protochlorophyllide a 8-vinyl-reductase